MERIEPSAGPTCVFRLLLRFEHPHRRRHSSRRLFVSQGHQGIDFGRAAGGDITGDQRHGNQNQRDSEEGWQVGGFDAVEQARQEPRQGQRADGADDNTNQRQLESLPYNKPQHVAFFCPQREADADFMRAPTGGIGDKPIKSDGSQRKRQSGKQAQTAR